MKLFSFLLIIWNSNFAAVWADRIQSNPACEGYRKYHPTTDNIFVLECDKVVNDLRPQIRNLPNYEGGSADFSIRTHAAGKNFNLQLSKTDGMLVNEESKVWRKSNFESQDCNDQPSNITELLPSFQKIAFYQDRKNHAALTVAPTPDGHSLMIRGFINDYYLGMMPDTNEYVLFKIHLDTTHVLKYENDRTLETVGNHRITRSFDLKSCRRFIYPKLVIALDTGLLKEYNEDVEDLLLHLLAYYNAVDMTFSKFKNPQIKLHISEIIIPTGSSVPYFKADRVENTPVVSTKKHEQHEYFLEGGKQLVPPESYDIVLQMTRSKFRDPDVSKCSDGVWSVQVYGDRRFYASIRHPLFCGDYSIATEILNIILRKNTAEIPTLRYRNHLGDPYAWLESDVSYLAKEFRTDDFFNRYTKPKSCKA